MNPVNIIPIRVERRTPTEAKIIEWRIHNVCNYDCTFCGLGNKNGSERWLTLTEYKIYAQKLINAANGKPLCIYITGGEPTLFPDLLPLLEFLKSKGVYIGLQTNGSRTIRWWQELADTNLVDVLIISFHSDTVASTNHVIDVFNIFHNKPTLTICMVTHSLINVEWALQAHHEIVENTGIFKVVMKTMWDNGEHGKIDIADQYSDETMVQLKNNNTITGKLFDTKKQIELPPTVSTDTMLSVIYNNESVETYSPYMLSKEQKNNFYGWHCEIGKKYLFIEQTKIFRGACRMGGEYADLTDDNIQFPNDSLRCEASKCFCSRDLEATKYLTK